MNLEQLQNIGIDKAILDKFFLSTEKPELSRLLIAKDFKIFLPDFDKEISLKPLPKTVFILFLKHPEGILLKHLSDYTDELFSIYKSISNRDTLDEMSKSILDLVDPTKNSINEKCSRIREAFVSELEDSIAQYYYIIGDKAEVKKILIDRRFVLWDANI